MRSFKHQNIQHTTCKQVWYYILLIIPPFKLINGDRRNVLLECLMELCNICLEAYFDS